MRPAAITLIIFLFSFKVSAQNLAPVDTSRYYEFHLNYWLNAHHFLWLESFLKSEKDSTAVTEKLERKDAKTWAMAVDYYEKNLAQQDLRSSDYMSSFKQWIITQDEPPSEIPEKFKAHMEVLIAVDPVYQKYFWGKHEQACKAALAKNIELLRRIESEFVDQITTVTRQFWNIGRIRIDLTYVGKSNKWNIRNNPYTTVFPTHVVMNAVSENGIPGNWIELLFHESSHHLILPGSYFVSGTIKDYVEAKGIKAPRQLWHAYLFYFSGQITKKLLIAQGVDYPITYMERNQVFSRYFSALDKHLTTYMDRHITLSEATYLIIEDLSKARE